MAIATMHIGSGSVMPLPSIPWPIINRLVVESETPEQSWIVADGAVPFEVTQSVAEWATEQWRDVDLGDARLNRRAVQMGASMARHPSHSLPRQMGDRAMLRAAYGMLNHPGVTLEQLSKPHWENTRQAAGQHEVVLFVQDTTELDYTHHPTKKGIGPIGNNKGQGLLLHSTLGVVPGTTPQILGVAHQQVVLRRPVDQPRPKYTGSAEGQVWAQAAEAVGAPPEGVLWVHVGDRGSDDFRFMHTCRGKHFLIRVARNRLLEWEEEEMGPEMRKLVDFARTLPSQHRYTLNVPAQHKRRARTAQMCLAWAEVTIPAPAQGPPELRRQPSITAWVIRAWEVDAPLDAEAIEWVLLTSVPTETVVDAEERVRWYTCRWLTEDYHQCLKTGCAIEKRQLDHGDDIGRLLGWCGPIAVRLLQMRNVARVEPQAPAELHVDSLVIEILAQRLNWTSPGAVTMDTFWRGVAQLGGYLGRRGDGPPGWKTIWHGWQYLDDLVTGAHLYAAALTGQRIQGGRDLRLNAILNDGFH